MLKDDTIKGMDRLKQAKKAFTLGETLITLMVIGIIAILVLPHFIISLNEIILKNQFKVAYSRLTQAVKIASSDFGGTPYCFYAYNTTCEGSTSGTAGTKTTHHDYLNGYQDLYLVSTAYDDYTGGTAAYTPFECRSQSSDCNAFYSAFIKSLNIAQTCKNNAYPTCIPKYEGYDETYKNKALNNDSYKATVRSAHPEYSQEDLDNELAVQVELVMQLYNIYNATWSTSSMNTKHTAHILSNGQILLEAGTNGSEPRTFAVDINGRKGPNKWGYDVFPFAIGGNITIPLFLYNGGGVYLATGGKSTTDMINTLKK